MRAPSEFVEMRRFAEAHSNPDDWERDGGEVVAYRSDHGRVRISFEKNTSLEYVGKSIVYRDDHPLDYSEVFAGDLIAAIREHLSAHDLHMLLQRLVKELSCWQFEAGSDKRTDICGEAAREICKDLAVINAAKTAPVVVRQVPQSHGRPRHIKDGKSFDL